MKINNECSGRLPYFLAVYSAISPIEYNGGLRFFLAIHSAENIGYFVGIICLSSELDHYGYIFDVKQA
jgi:hypothetical protein